MIMIEIQCSSTAILLLVNPCIYTVSKQRHCMPQWYQLLSKNNALCCQICSTHYTAVWINNCLKYFCNQSSHYKSYGWFLLWMEAITCLPKIWHFSWWAQVNGTHRRALVSPWRMHFMYSGMASWAEATPNSKINQPCSLSHCQVMRVWRHQVVGS